jgi:hypothetical protein
LGAVSYAWRRPRASDDDVARYTRRVRRTLPNLLTVLLALLCLAVVVFWVRAEVGLEDRLAFDTLPTTGLKAPADRRAVQTVTLYSLQSGSDGLSFVTYEVAAPWEDLPWRWRAGMTPTKEEFGVFTFSRMGHAWGGRALRYERRSYPTSFIGPTRSALVASHWLCAAVAALLPTGRFVGRLVRRRRARRVAGGLCAVCGYDFRATPGRCPECGAGNH